MKCYYEVLGVKRDVCDEDLRKSYKRLALQFHPDKNRNNEEEAKAKFQEIQNAYEVLSDPQERAFYDRNRESILQGEEYSSGLKEEIHLYKYFSATCFTGFDDSETGFYTVYRRAFQSIAAQDMKYMDDEEEEIFIPNFGRSDTDLEDVVTFYGYWQSYCTSVSFCWVDKYNIREAQNRWVEKRIERENKKIRDKAKKEFNEEVKSLVAFVRKRDKRWQARKKLLEDKIAENARKQQEYQRRQREQRRKMVEETLEEQRDSILQYERQLKEMESQYAAEWGTVSDDSLDEAESEEEEQENVELMMEGLYCIACEKLFKSEKAFINHEKSRKHKEKQTSLASFMKEEELEFTGHKEIETNNDEEEKYLSLSSEEEVKISSSRKKKKKKKKQAEDILNTETIRKKAAKTNKQTLGEEFTKLHLNDNSANEETELKSRASPHMDTESKEEVLSDTSFTDNVEIKKQKLKGKKAKDARKKLQQQNNDSLKDENVCSVCSENFKSKNKLFNHLKSSGHAIIKGQTSKSNKSKR